VLFVEESADTGQGSSSEVVNVAAVDERPVVLLGKRDMSLSVK
jgi:hypothetical protein